MQTTRPRAAAETYLVNADGGRKVKLCGTPLAIHKAWGAATCHRRQRPWTHIIDGWVKNPHAMIRGVAHHNRPTCVHSQRRGPVQPRVSVVAVFKSRHARFSDQCGHPQSGFTTQRADATNGVVACVGHKNGTVGSEAQP